MFYCIAQTISAYFSDLCFLSIANKFILKHPLSPIIKGCLIYFYPIIFTPIPEWMMFPY